MLSKTPDTDGLNARAELQRLVNGFEISQALHVAATLRLADHLRNGPMSARQLASAINANEAALYRLMRALASIGVLREEQAGFVLTSVGEYLRSDVPGTLASMAEFVGRPNVWQAWGALLHAVRTGDTAFDHVHGRDVWDYRSRHPEETHVFDRAMASGTEVFAEAVLAAYDFGGFEHVVDVGGGDGMFLSKILARYPRIRGTLFDQPHVVARAPSPPGFRGRYSAVGGDFFDRMPEGADAYLLKWILHDWSDRASVDILRACRRAMPPGGKLLIAEYVIERPNASADGAFMDIMMMVMCGGRERTLDEFAAIFAAAGFRLTSVIKTATPLSIIEGVSA
jgi:hypothetical protein